MPFYRNTVAASLIDALPRAFPSSSAWSAMTSSGPWRAPIVALEPPSSPLLFLYGEGFAAFIARFAPAAPLPYLADVARLEYFRGLAYHAADREPLRPASFAALDKGRLADFNVTLHPSVFVVTSIFPVLSIWLANQAEPVRRCALAAPSRRWSRGLTSLSRRDGSSRAPMRSLRR